MKYIQRWIVNMHTSLFGWHVVSGHVFTVMQAAGQNNVIVVGMLQMKSGCITYCVTTCLKLHSTFSARAPRKKYILIVSPSILSSTTTTQQPQYNATHYYLGYNTDFSWIPNYFQKKYVGLGKCRFTYFRPYHS